MQRIKYHPPGTPPATLVASQEAQSRPPEICLIQYNETDFTENHPADIDAVIAQFSPNHVNWINIDGLGDLALLRRLSEQFHINPLALEDVLNTTQRPKVEYFTNHFFVVSAMMYFEDDKSLTIEQVSLFVGENFVITLQEEAGHDVFETVRMRLRSGRGFGRRMGPDYLCYALLDATVDHIFPVLENVGDAIEDIEVELLDRPTRSCLKRLYESKRILLQLRRAAWPQREIFNTLMRDESGLIARDTQIFLRDCYDHTTQIIDIIESYRDLSAGLMDLYLSSLGFRTNEIMRVLTVVSVLFIPLTFLAGVYGMNFNTDEPLNMPELDWPYGYIAFWVVCLVVLTTMLTIFKKRQWL